MKPNNSVSWEAKVPSPSPVRNVITMEFLVTWREDDALPSISNQQRHSTCFSEHVLHFMPVKVVISDKKVRQKNNG